jgi:thiosulfate dehydrogenase
MLGNGDSTKMIRILFGFVFGLVCIPAAVWYWYHHSVVPVAVADEPFPQERDFAHKILQERIAKEMVQIPPIQPDEQNLIAGAHIYAQKCAVCHGYYGKPAPLGDAMYPAAPPLWEKHQNGPAVGVSDDLPGETYWKVANGIRLTGMPEFKTQLNNTEMWQVSLLLAHADKPLPPEALSIVRPVAPQAPGHPKDQEPAHPGTLDE